MVRYSSDEAKLFIKTVTAYSDFSNQTASSAFRTVCRQQHPSYNYNRPIWSSVTINSFISVTTCYVTLAKTDLFLFPREVAKFSSGSYA